MGGSFPFLMGNWLPSPLGHLVFQKRKCETVTEVSERRQFACALNLDCGSAWCHVSILSALSEKGKEAHPAVLVLWWARQ